MQLCKPPAELAEGDGNMACKARLMTTWIIITALAIAACVTVAILCNLFGLRTQITQLPDRARAFKNNLYAYVYDGPVEDQDTQIIRTNTKSAENSPIATACQTEGPRGVAGLLTGTQDAKETGILILAGAPKESHQLSAIPSKTRYTLTLPKATPCGTDNPDTPANKDICEIVQLFIPAKEPDTRLQNRETRLTLYWTAIKPQHIWSAHVATLHVNNSMRIDRLSPVATSMTGRRVSITIPATSVRRNCGLLVTAIITTRLGKNYKREKSAGTLPVISSPDIGWAKADSLQVEVL